MLSIAKQARVKRLLKSCGNGAKGVILWKGESLLNGKPIMVILRFAGNAKTGANSSGQGGMHTTYIVPDIEGTSFNEARQQGLDESVCGLCPLKGTWSEKLGRVTNRICYVSGPGLAGLYQSIKAGNYPTIWWLADQARVDIGELLDFISPVSTPLRIGGWGDGAAVPHTIWEALEAEKREQCTMYTHQWRWLEMHRSGYDPHCNYIKSISMASCHAPWDVTDAKKLSWRMFITVPPLNEVPVVPQGRYSSPRSVVSDTLKRLGATMLARCPADKNLATPLTCDICPIKCNGKGSEPLYESALGVQRHDVWIPAHGAPSILAAMRRSGHFQAWIREFNETITIAERSAA